MSIGSTHRFRHSEESNITHEVSMTPLNRFTTLALFFSLAVLAAYASQLPPPAPLTLLTDYPQAKCLDGTPSGYYMQGALDQSSAHKWVIFLEGGGECNTQVACQAATTNALGSSKYFPASRQWLPFDVLSPLPDANPVFYDWNHVDVTYCTQDLHSGQVTQPSAEQWGLYFAGRHVFTAVIDSLVAHANLSYATEIVLSGASAGGIGVWIHLDYLSQRFPQARVVGLPVAGFYFYAYPYTGLNHSDSGLADFRPQAWPHTYSLWQAYADEDCIFALADEPWACLLANYSAPYIHTPTFVVEAQTDEVVLTAHDWMPSQWRFQPPEQAYMAAWHANMTQGLLPWFDLSDGLHGVFNPACFTHTSFNISAPLIAGSSYHDAVKRWYYYQPGDLTMLFKLQDDCGLECNPTCPASVV